MNKVQERYVMLCHHCGNMVPHKLVHHHSTIETVYSTEGEPLGLNPTISLLNVKLVVVSRFLGQQNTRTPRSIGHKLICFIQLPNSLR